VFFKSLFFSRNATVWEGKMKKLIIGLAILALPMLACDVGGVGVNRQATVEALQTEVALLSTPPATNTPLPTATPIPTYTPLPTYTPRPTPTPAPTVAPSTPVGIKAREDEAALLGELAKALEGEGWESLFVEETYIAFKTPEEGVFRFSYSYDSPTVNRIIIYALWGGKGQSNLSYDVLQEINRVNDDLNLAKVSVDADGDLWIESVYPFSRGLDVEAFVDYMTWFEESEELMVLLYLTDYVQ
jgi:hypothetical protein